jgi:hypothetical protein
MPVRPSVADRQHPQVARQRGGAALVAGTATFEGLSLALDVGEGCLDLLREPGAVEAAERDEKRPEVGLSRGPRGSDNSPGMAAFCGIPTADQEREKNVPTGRLAEGEELCSNTFFDV